MSAAEVVTITFPAAQFQRFQNITDVISWTTAICLAVATWDWLSSFGEEWSRIWKREKSVISVLYIGARYWILISLSVNVWMYLSETHSLEYCEKWHRINIGINVPVEVFSGLILLVRTYAFTRQNPFVIAVLGTCYIGQIIFQCICVRYGIALLPWFQVGQTKGRCFTGASTNNLLVLGYFLTPLLYATICMALTIHESLRSRNRLAAVRKSPVFHIFMREGAVYYLAMAIVVLVNIVFMAQSDTSVRGCAYFFMPLIDATMSCRLVLSLRDADNTQFNSNVNVKSLWASAHFEGEGEPTDRNPSTQMGAKDETFALSAVDRTGNSNIPVQINIERVVHFSVDDEYADNEKKA